MRVYEGVQKWRKNTKSINKQNTKKKQRNHNNMEWRHDITKKKKQGDCSFALCVTLSFCSFIANRKGY